MLHIYFGSCNIYYSKQVNLGYCDKLGEDGLIKDTPNLSSRDAAILSQAVILPVMLKRLSFALVKVYGPEIEKSQLRRIADDHFYIRRVLGYCPPPLSKTAILIDRLHPFT